MAGIYIHIPFCRQACHYCNFHFATSLHHKTAVINAINKEIVLRSIELNEPVETIYFGGGTPSLCTREELQSLVQSIKNNYTVAPDTEITLEANPDDIQEGKLADWGAIGINRLSIGVQSFFEEDLLWMNRAHDATQARDCLHLAKKYFDNITTDLIYGTPALTNEKWKTNVETAIALDIPHLSCYALTVEPKTPLDKMIRQHKSADVDPDRQSEQFLLLMQWLADAGYEHYEISNFAKPGWRSKHNSSYWQGKKYIGIGPSAHSFDGQNRQWNIANNSLYTRSLENDIIPAEKETLTPTQRLNEYIMISLRTMEGLQLGRVDNETADKIMAAAGIYIDRGLLKQEGNSLRLTNEGKLLADGIAADLFF